MKIVKMDIKGFGKFEDGNFELQPGMNVIFGCNESGKSTLQSFIKGMLFGLKGGRRAKDGTLPPMRQYKPWFARTYSGMIVYELDNGQTFTVSRNFDKNAVTVYDGYSNNITGEFPAGKEEGVKFAEQHLCLSESCFGRTVFIGQMQSVITKEGKKVIAERLTNIKQTGDEEVSFRKALGALKDAQLNHVGSERTTIRPLNIINSRLQKAIEEENEYRRLHESCMDTFLQLDQLQKKETEFKMQLNELKLIREKLIKENETEKLKKNCSTLKEYYIKLSTIENQIKGIREEMDNTLTELKEYEGYENFSRNHSDEMVSDYTNYKLLCKESDEYRLKNEENEEKIQELEKELDKYSLFSDDTSKMDEVINDVLQYNRTRMDGKVHTKPTVNTKRWACMSGLCIGIIILMSAFVFRSKLSMLFALIGAAISVVSGLFLLFSLKHGMDSKGKDEDLANAKKIEKHLNLLNSWMEEVKVDNIHDFLRLKNLCEDKNIRLNEFLVIRKKLEESGNSITIRMEEFKTRIQNKLTDVHIIKDSENFEQGDIQKWRVNLENHNSLVQEVKTTETKISSMFEKKDSLYREVSVISGTNVKSLDELDKELKDIQSKINSFTQVESEEDTQCSEYLSVEAVAAEIKKIDEELAQTSLKINTLSTRLENIPDGDMIQRAHEMVQTLSEEKEEKIHLGKALETAISILSKASLEIQRDYSPYLNKEMGSILNGITAGRYIDIMADDSLSLNIKPPDISERVIPEQLSSGTADQVYFALRLATVRLVEKDGETLPLFLDEPFVQYDEDRTKNALMLLYNESHRRQIVLFTCKKREVELARQTFSDNEVNVINL